MGAQPGACAPAFGRSFNIVEKQSKSEQLAHGNGSPPEGILYLCGGAD
jgi:hypothetical protein